MKLILSCLIVLSSSIVFAQKSAPKLVVGIVVDQMCYDYLYRYYDKYGEDGFKKLMRQGTNCRNTNYNYVPTYTGPGHASIYTGTTPNNHGIVANDWYDRSTNSSINCVDDSTVTAVGSESLYGKYSPVNLKTNTITDQLKMTYPQSKVISVSIKNRGAILPGGHLSDGSYWFDYLTGRLISSTFFMEKLPLWVQKFNKNGYPEKSLKETWNTLLPIEEYTESGPDNSPYEHLIGNKTTPTFPYNLEEMSSGRKDFSPFTVTPFANTYLTDFAIDALEAEQLGADNQTDMLCISYSTPDIAGHTFGTTSIEIEDIYLRLDQEIARLIKSLEEKVGKNEFTLFLTADHAVVPVPQYLLDNKMAGGYFFLDQRMMELQAKTKKRFGWDPIEAVTNLNIYLDKDSIELKKMNYRKVVNFVYNEVIQWEGVKRVFSGDMLYTLSNDDEWRDMITRGYHHEESGDIIFMLESGYLPKSTDSETARKGTSHGSAYSYDTHVPLLWYGNSIPSREVHRNVNITDIAATLAQLMYLQNPHALTGDPILEIFGE